MGSLNYQVRKIGININQITKKINAGYGNPSDAMLLADELREVELLMNKVIEECEKRWQSQS